MRTAHRSSQSTVSTASRPLWRIMRDRRASAEQVLRHFDVVEAPVDIEGIARGLGVVLTYLDSPGWSGAVKATESGDRVDIWIARGEPPHRQRFTIAHEIGHLILHDVVGRAYRDSNFNGSPEEAQANGYAAALLMPYWLLQAEVDMHGPDATFLASRFGVSEAAMSIRLGKLARW